ncbi:MAG: MG2 domain-containing protein [Balneola sp.]
MLRTINLSYLFLLITFFSCAKPDTSGFSVPIDFEEYVSGHTSGEISKFDEIAVSLSGNQSPKIKPTDGLFEFDPAVKGETQWVNDRTVLFKPSSPLKSDKEYTVRFNLGKILELDEQKETFVFNFSTVRQDMEVEFSGIEPLPGNRNQQKIEGVVYTADRASLEDLKRTITAEQGGDKLSFSWSQLGSGKEHKFQISGIERKERASVVTVRWNGSPIGAEAKGEREIEVLAKGAFELLETRVFRDQNPRIELTFSDPLDVSQNLNGLVTLERSAELNFIVNENKLTINPRTRRNEPEILIINEAIRSASGNRLGVTHRREVRFSQPQPAVSFLGKGVIIPRSDDLLIPFKAVSLGAVDVQVTRIFENNVGQFLQEQNLGGVNQWNIRRVGRPVFGGVIPLSTLGNLDPGTWNNYALDLSKLIEPEPGAIYMVEIGFRAHQAVYPCEAGNTIVSEQITNREWKLSAEEEEAYWNNFGGYYYPRNYNWRDRDNPCSVSYYSGNRRVQKNVLASDLGLIAKKGENEEVHFFVTDLRTAQPKTGVSVSVFDFQQQQIAESQTGADGKTILSIDRSPYYAIADFENQKGYLRLDDGTALSVSDFDVSGATVQKGVKGFLYGERGVWRPGDTLFVSLILEDENDVLPEDHPVTFELRDPSGQLIDRETFTTSLNGFYVYRVKTEKQAPTGNWRLTARVGGLSFNKTLKIESVKPNRLKVEVDFKEDYITANTRKLEATLSSQWLHGASAKKLKADVEMSLTASEPVFKDFPGFSFSDESVSFTGTPEQIFEGTLNASGKREFNHQFGAFDRGPGRLKVNLNLRVFEPSGSFSVGRAATYYYPFKTLVGLKAPEAEDNRYGNWLSRREAHAFKVVSVDEEGTPVGFKDLEYEVYRIGWRWWWERGSENISSFFERREVRKVLNGEITTRSDGTNELNLSLPQGEDGGRYLIRIVDPKGRHSASQVVYFSWWGSAGTSVSPARLTFNSDKETYNADEEVKLNIPSSKGSKILVSLETGSKILKTAWIDGQEDETTFSFYADASMSPTIYAHVMHIQQHAQKENDLPIRMYGVIPINIEDPFTKLNPQIETQAEFKPETNTTINISEENGRELTYTIAMVDEGLLDLTNFKTPQPHDVFYAREALGVKTWDMFEFVTSGFSGNISRILSVGGDGSEQALDPLNEANRFKPMVRFEGPFYLKAGETNQHTISIPNYVGSVRTMVIAGQDGAYGQTEKTTPVRKPVMVLATLPRVLGPAETVHVPVSVFAMKDDIRNVNVRIEASDIFEIQGDASATIRFEEPGDQLINFKLKTKSEIGVGTVRVEVKSVGETAYHEIELAVRNPNTPFTDIKSEVLEEDETWSVSFNPQGMIGTNSAMLEVSRIPPIDFGRRLDYLLRYPHGCIEQTTSSAFPQLFLAKVMDVSEAQQARIEQNIEAAITRISRFLTPGGGLSYWSGYETANTWATSYAYHFLLEAQKLGYYVPSNLMNSINRFQRSYARNWSKSEYRRSDLTQAYRLYTLALANTPELGAMNRFRERSDLSPQAKWRLAAAYVLTGQPEAANDIVSGVSVNVPEYRELSGNFGSAVRDQAMILETMALLGRGEEAALLARELSTELSSKRWLSTQTTAYSLIAITKFLDEFNATSEMIASFTLNGERDGAIRTSAFISQIPLNMDEYSENELVLENKSEGTLFARLVLQGTPLIGDNVSASNSLVQKVRFIDLNGDQIDPKEIEQGTDFVAEVSLRNPGLRGNYEEMALTQVFPSGWEIRNTRMDGESFSEPTSRFDYQDIRDDRVFTYFDLGSNTTKVHRIQLNAGYLGEFYLPAVQTEAMYDETISARTPGMWVKVVAPN